jgi:electron-transferring-flavoprotein dehydrogenase
MRSGMTAAETIFECLVNDDFSLDRLEKYSDKLVKTKEYNDLYRTRNFHQAMEKGLYLGMMTAGIQHIMEEASSGFALNQPLIIQHLKKVKELYGREDITDQKRVILNMMGK